MIKYLVFDVNGVLHYPSPKGFFPSKERLSIKQLAVFFLISKSKTNKRANLGEITERNSIVEALCAEFPKHAEVIQEIYQKNWEYYFTENRPMTALLKDCAKKLPVYVLSNQTSPEKERILQYDFNRYLSGSVYSCDVGKKKPDHEIYRILLDTYHLNAEECLFIDDRKKNITAAKELGFQTFHITPFRNASSLEEYLKRYGI